MPVSPCLEDVTWSGDWPAWLEAAGAKGLELSRGPAFSLYALAIEEARNGAGDRDGARGLDPHRSGSGAGWWPRSRLARETGRNLVLTVSSGQSSNRYLDRVTALLTESAA